MQSLRQIFLSINTETLATVLELLKDVIDHLWLRIDLHDGAFVEHLNAIHIEEVGKVDFVAEILGKRHTVIGQDQ